MMATVKTGTGGQLSRLLLSLVFVVAQVMTVGHMAHAEHDDLGHHPSESTVCSFYVFAATNNDLDVAPPPSIQMSLCELGRVVVSQPGRPDRSERGKYTAPRGPPRLP